MRRLSETLRSVADAIAAGVGNLPTDIELQPISNAVRSVLAVLPPGEAPPCGEAQPAAALRYPATAVHSSRYGL